MTTQVLVATMNQTDFSLLEKMNIQTDAIVCNQCDKNEVTEFDYKGNKIKWLSFAEQGVGLNRNNALMRATADICILADDDMIFNKGYLPLALMAFDKLKKADVIIFNLDEEEITQYKNTKIRKINKLNYAKYGAARIAFRRDKVLLESISFNLLFGGGAKYSAGEDTLFLKKCLDSGLKIYAVPYSLACLTDSRPSTWFTEYNDKYFYDKGVLFYSLKSKFCKSHCFYHCLKHRKRYKAYGWFKAYKMMLKGIKSVK